MLLKNFFKTTLKTLSAWTNKNKRGVLPYSTACCGVEWMNAIHDHATSTSPNNANILLVLGPVTVQQAPHLKKTFDQMRTPKGVIAVGACATSGGLYQNYNVVPGVDQIIPVDVFVPGCPPKPEQILEAIETLKEIP